MTTEESNFGRYDEDTKEIMIRHGARAALVIVLGGDVGNGFSFSTINKDFVGLIPDLLRSVAAEIERKNQ